MKFASLLLSLSLSSPVFASIRITVDPGHGGEDKGAVHAQVQESQIALSISKKLYGLLKKDPLFTPQILRNKDKALSLEQRVKKAEKFRTQLFISIHANAHPNQKARGAEFYIENQLPIEEESLLHAHNEAVNSLNQQAKPQGDVESILSDLDKTSRIISSYQVSSYLRKNWSQKKSKIIRQGPFFVLNQSKVPSVLIEVGYLTNKKERNKLILKSEQNRIAKKIHKALKDYAKNMDKLPSSILQPQNAKTR